MAPPPKATISAPLNIKSPPTVSDAAIVSVPEPLLSASAISDSFWDVKFCSDTSRSPFDSTCPVAAEMVALPIVPEIATAPAEAFAVRLPTMLTSKGSKVARNTSALVLPILPFGVLSVALAASRF